jgi:glycosyltransferase involved in cell wall biosynthesis
VIPHERLFFDRPFTAYFLSACDAFLTMSHSVLAELRPFIRNKPAAYVPHPMYDMFGPAMSKAAAREKLKLEADKPYLLFFGFIRKYKGLQLLLDAFADPRIKTLDLRLIVAGEFYEDEAPYLRKIAELGLKDRVILHKEFIPNSEVSTYFCAADAVVQTYLHATQSGVTQIAYFYDKPMIVTNVGGLAELVPNNKVGYIVNVDKADIADAIVRFYSEAKEREFVEQLKTEKQRFTWAHLCGELIKLSKA